MCSAWRVALTGRHSSRRRQQRDRKEQLRGHRRVRQRWEREPHPCAVSDRCPAAEQWRPQAAPQALPSFQKPCFHWPQTLETRHSLR